MELKLKITEQLRQLQLTMQRSAFRDVQAHSSYRGQGRVLSILMEKPEMSRRELGEKLDISRQALTELMKKMEKRGYVLRRPDPKDRRVQLVRLTQKGRQAAEENRQDVQNLSRLLECLSDEKLTLFSECLEAILAHERELYPNSCNGCTGPENCSHDYLKYGHTLPNPRFCKYAHLFSEAQAGADDDEDCAGGDRL